MDPACDTHVAAIGPFDGGAADCGIRPDYDPRVSTYVLMRILESAPDRYDSGLRLLTFGSIDRAYDRLASHVGAGARVLDIGCGTGALALRAAARGARVKGIDVSAGMLEVAARRAREAGLGDSIELEEMGVALLDGEAAGSFDAVMSGLCFSELSDDEITYTLTQIRRILRPGGLLLLADEVRPRKRATRIAVALVRAPLSALAYVVAGRTSRAVERLPERVAAAGLEIESTVTSALGSFCAVVARKPKGETP
jgi:demethylmenaquinone methyltransferase/2-methoxy-6-polyprenyl-1,4-benzoquinol methylase